MRSFAATFALMICCALAPYTANASQDPARNTESLLRAHDRFARAFELDGAIDGFVPNLTDDVAYLYPDQEIITGREATRTFLKTIYAQPRTVRTLLHRVAGQASADGSLGYTFGWLEEVTAPKNAPSLTKYGRFIAMWKQRDDGWRVQAFLRLASSAPLAPVPADALIVDGAAAVVHPGLPAAQRLEIATADSRFADLSIDQGYTVAFTSYDMPESVIVTGGSFFWNHAGVEFAWSGWTPAEQLSWYPLRTEAAGSGDLGWSIGHGTYTFNGSPSYSKYLTVWVRTEAGWRFLMDGGNGRPAP
ncbi:MAG TPA: nuclear transport factor 2 family protein [Steroidobacteraceae bacterium]|nr:nuclear transport factor 2 family protein [Steroidobacteraceae bacterium]